jgi:hypothetical protein
LKREVEVMTLVLKSNTTEQIAMPGMPKPVNNTVATCCELAPGQVVVYVGKIMGGPRFGTRGIVKQALQRKAVIDMGKHGTWNVPYFFLTLPQPEIQQALAA